MSQHHSFNIVGKTAHFFADNKPLSLLILIGVLGFGFLAFIFTPKQYNPEIVRPAFSLTLMYQGATTEESVHRVVYELVEKISAVPGVDEVMTEVRDGGMIGTTVIFDVGYDAVKAKVDLLTQVEQHSYFARGFVTKPSVMEINPETIPVLQIVFSSPTLSIEEVRERTVAIGHELTQIGEVSDVSVYGGYVPTLVVEVDLARLQSTGITVTDVEQALRQGESRVVLSGYENEQNKIGIVFDGQVKTAEEVGALPISPRVRVRDVAQVFVGALPNRPFVLYDTKDHEPTDVVMLSVSKVEGSSAPLVTESVRGMLESVLDEESFEGLTYKVVSDDGVTASLEIRGLAMNLMQSIGIVAVVLLIFLSLRSASVVLIAIPTTLLIVFGLGFLFDQSINRITLFALILSLGLLVDSAIVVVENMYVHLKRASGELASATREIIIAGSVNEIGVGLFLSTATSVVVFLPVSYITGMMGPYMAPVAFFVPAALIVSMFVAIIVVPYVASYVLVTEEKKGRFGTFVDASVERVIAVYEGLIRRILVSQTLQKRILFGTLGVFFLTLTLPLFGLEHFQMLPRADRDQFYVYLDAPIDTSLEETKQISGEISDVVLRDANVTSVQQFVGTPPLVDFNGMFKGAQYRDGSHQSTIRVNLMSAGERARSSSDVATDIRGALRQHNAQYARMTRLIEEPPGPPVRATLVAKISSTDDEARASFARAVAPFIASVSGVVDPYISTDAETSNVLYSFDREQAMRLGVAESEVLSVLNLYGQGITVTEFMTQGVEYSPVVLTLPRAGRDAPADMDSLRVHGNDGTLIPITTVLKKTYGARVQTEYLERGEVVTYITGEVETRPIIYVVIEIMRSLIGGDLEGYAVEDWNLFALTLRDVSGETVTLTWGGEWEMTLENFRDLGIAMGVALVLVYAILVAQYRSFRKPAFIMVTVPLGLIGILIGFLVMDNVFGVYLTATALIGFIALVGIVVNNAIIFSEYVDQAIEEGIPYEEALVSAGGARFRPIMLTSLTTILGSLTIASDPVWSGLAWAIVFGLSLSTVMTLVVYPTLLVYFHRGEKAHISN